MNKPFLTSHQSGLCMFIRTWSKATTGALIHWCIWNAVAAIILGTSSSEAKIAYSFICGWWASLYIGFIFNISLRSLVPLSFISMLFAAASAWFSLPSFPFYFHDVGGRGWEDFVFIASAETEAYGMPILVNALIRAALRKLKREPWVDRT